MHNGLSNSACRQLTLQAEGQKILPIKSRKSQDKMTFTKKALGRERLHTPVSGEKLQLSASQALNPRQS